jgi:hypothetical protein
VIVKFLDHLFDDIALLVELREYLFLQGPPERWPVSVVRGLQPAFDELQASRDRIVTDARWVDGRTLREAGLDRASLELKLAHVEPILESLGARIAHALKELKQLLEKLCTGTADELDLRPS